MTEDADWTALHEAHDRILARYRHLRTSHDELEAALKTAISIADEAREEWDKAPSGMRAGKLLIALSGHLKGYRPDIDAIHAAIVKAT